MIEKIVKRVYCDCGAEFEMCVMVRVTAMTVKKTCPRCGGSFDTSIKNQKFCSQKCGASQSGLFPLTEDELWAEFEKMSMAAIARKYKMTPQRVQYHCRKMLRNRKFSGLPVEVDRCTVKFKSQIRG